MEFNNGSTYLGISIIGFTSAAIFFNNDQESNAYLLLFLTVYLLSLLRFFLERQFYRSHKAILASLQFVLLPFIILFVGMSVSHRINFTLIFKANVSILSLPSFTLFINIISLTLIPPLIILHRMFYNYHSGRWSGFAIRRKLYSSRKIPYVLHSVLTLSLIYLGDTQGVFDGVVVILILIWFIHTVKYYILSIIKNRRSTDYVNNLLNNSNYVSRRNTQRSSSRNSMSNYLGDPPSTSVRGSTNPRTTREIPALSRSGGRTVSSQYSNARKIKTTPKKKKKLVNKSKRKISPKSKGSITVDEGRELKTVKGTAKINGDITKILPTGKVDKNDLSCMYCYEKFHASDNNIVLCPHCKYPGHLNEYISWIQISNLCGRCSKVIPKSEQTNPKYQFNAKDYVSKVIAKL